MADQHTEYAPAPGAPPTLIDERATVSRSVPLALVIEPLDPMRHNIDDQYLEELAADIRNTGLLNPPSVVPILNNLRVRVVVTDGRELDEHEARGGMYRVAAGHCRLLACRMIRLGRLDVRVYCDTDVSEEQIMAAENTHRSDPSDFDLAVMYSKWLREPGITENEVRRRSGKTLDFVYARAELLEGWKEVADALHARKIKFTVARALNREEDEAYMRHFLNMAMDQGATSKLVNAWVAEHKAQKDMAAAPGPAQRGNVTVNAPQTIKIECLCCGDTQSYNLLAKMVCGACVERIEKARAEVLNDSAS